MSARFGGPKGYGANQGDAASGDALKKGAAGYSSAPDLTATDPLASVGPTGASNGSGQQQPPTTPLGAALGHLDGRKPDLKDLMANDSSKPPKH
ncbi:hypothetical protein [Methylocystis parvus]|uniref:hypothetical protein n=1 Tax=Methylocystis parvus TaxID=134 RepID=UPI003C76A085